ncbi:arylsulfatase [Cytophagaceae bacterium DM2B3-1]|uniref:Arylsulfatase n=1 Tax=Xanthocytophaga flava TaxID=3048013 RepID=A0ABT7CIU2_9BACT|nr:arylsulfatase [Xanthocytophaga flavus]MDJ1493653.1 arylsulfatase [Xanthocytophaga flavus]
MKPKIIQPIGICLILFFSLSCKVSPVKQQAARQPNIIFLLADDLGYGNLTCYNSRSPIPTPNIDQLAREGTRFTRFYSGSTVCAPSRASLMTGLHMGHSYIRGNTRLPLRLQDTTLAQRLQSNGYVTGMFGKWGLGEEGTPGSPEIKGFDESVGYLNQRHAHNYYTDYLFEVKNGKIQKIQIDSTQYSHDLIIQRAYSFIRSHKDQPFFLYLPVTIPHAELFPPASDLKAFQNADGSSKFAPETPYNQNGGSYRSQPQPHAAFAAMLTKLDGNVGELQRLVKELGLDNNTYIFFTSDNGPHKEGGADPEYFNSSGPLRGIKRDLYEGGIRVPMIVKMPGKVPAGRVSEQPWAFWDILPTFAELTNFSVPASVDGLSFVNELTGKGPQKPHEYLFWQFNEGYLQQAVVQGDWKLIRFKRKGQSETLELYNLKNDIHENNNLASAYPDKVKILYGLIKQSVTPAEHSEFDWSTVEQ